MLPSRKFLFRGLGTLTASGIALLPSSPSLREKTFTLSDSIASLPSLHLFLFKSPAVAIMGDSCALSIPQDCQQLGQGRNFSRSPRDQISGPGSKANCARVRAKGEGTGLSPVAQPHTCSWSLTSPSLNSYKAQRHTQAIAPHAAPSFYLTKHKWVRTSIPVRFAAHVPLKPHTSLHSISGVLIWGYKEACPHKGQQLDSLLLRHKAPFHSHRGRSSGNNRLNNG